MPTSTEARDNNARPPLAGSKAVHVPPRGKSDPSDWVELMEAVEALCPVWPARAPTRTGRCKL